MLIGQEIAKIQTVGTERAINTESEQSVLNTTLKATLQSAAEVRQFLAEPSMVIEGPKLADGKRVDFNKQSLATMDQFYGAYLLSQYGRFAALPPLCFTHRVFLDNK